MEFSQIVDPVFHDSNSFGSMIHGLRCLNVEVQGFDDNWTAILLFILILLLWNCREIHKARLPRTKFY